MKTSKLILLLFICCASILHTQAQCPTSSRPGVHVVQPNENLYRISLKYNLTIEQLCDWNDRTINQPLMMCTELLLTPKSTVPTSYNQQKPYTDVLVDKGAPKAYNSAPTTTTTTTTTTSTEQVVSSAIYRKQSGNRHTVQPGETMAGLAELYGYTEARFREFNAFGNNTITPGSVILSSDCFCDRVMYDEPNGLGYKKDFSTIEYVQPEKKQPYQPLTKKVEPTINKSAPSPDTKAITPTSTENTGTNASASYMQSEELQMLDEINLMRANPAAYAQYIDEYVQYQKDNNGFPVDPANIAELKQQLRSSPPLSQLKPTQCIYTAARKHGEDLRQMGRNDHVGSDGKWPWDRVLRECPNMTDGNENLVGGPSSVRTAVVVLLIDEGIPNRGHRVTLMRPDWKYAACYKIGQVGGMPNSWVQKFGL